MASVSESIMSVALLVAESIAVMRAACSAATDSSSARKIWMPHISAATPGTIPPAAARKCSPPAPCRTSQPLHRPRCRSAQAHSGADRRFLGLFLFFLRHLLGHADGRRADLFDGKNLLHNQALRNHRFEFVEHQIDRIDFFALDSARSRFRPSGGPAQTPTCRESPTCSPVI